jgi:hypothetical protein
MVALVPPVTCGYLLATPDRRPGIATVFDSPPPYSSSSSASVLRI